MNTIQVHWDEYIERTPYDSSAFPREVLKDAFYEGALSILNIQSFLLAENVSDSGAVQVIDGIYNEIDAYRNEKNMVFSTGRNKLEA